MYIVEVIQFENGAHKNCSYVFGVDIPEGWAVVLDETKCENFPFGDVEVEEIDVEGIGLVPVVTKWIPGVIPEPEPGPEPEPEPTADELMNILLGVSE